MLEARCERLAFQQLRQVDENEIIDDVSTIVKVIEMAYAMRVVLYPSQVLGLYRVHEGLRYVHLYETPRMGPDILTYCLPSFLNVGRTESMGIIESC